MLVISIAYGRLELRNLARKRTNIPYWRRAKWRSLFECEAGEYESRTDHTGDQRIALARAILKDAPTVVLDEATAFADPENEALIQKAFSELTRGRTVIMIAHRLSTVVGADKILVLDEGRIVEQGSHEELTAAGGLYARMWADYNQAVQWKITSEGEAK